MLSRQSNKRTLDFRLIENELCARDDGFNIVILCKKIEPGFSNRIAYAFHILRSMYHIATSRLCIVDTYCIPISFLRHKKDLVVIQIWHALGAVKKFGFQSLDKQEGRSSVIAKTMNMHKNYSCVFCASDSTKHFYAEAFNVPEEKIFVNGMPRIDYILGDDKVLKTRTNALLKKHPKLKQKQNILYVPTFRKDNNRDIKHIESFVDKSKYNLLVKLHPLEQLKEKSSFASIFHSRTFELLHIADYIITDYSAVSFEASLLEKPVFFYVYDLNEYNEKRGLNIDLYNEMSNCTFENFGEIMAHIDADKYDFEQLKTFRNKYVQTNDVHNTKRIVDSIYDFLEMDVFEFEEKDKKSIEENQKVSI